jgi:hypothetical protein
MITYSDRCWEAVMWIGDKPPTIENCNKYLHRTVGQESTLEILLNNAQWCGERAINGKYLSGVFFVKWNNRQVSQILSHKEAVRYLKLERL